MGDTTKILEEEKYTRHRKKKEDFPSADAYASYLMGYDDAGEDWMEYSNSIVNMFF